MGTRGKSKVDYMSTAADVERNSSDGSRVPGETPMHDAGANGADCVPGSLKFRYELWEWVWGGATHRKHNCFHTSRTA